MAPEAMQAAMLLSIAITGSAMCYFFSDGGDLEKLDKNLTMANPKLAETRATLADFTVSLADTGSKMKEAFSAWTSGLGSKHHDSIDAGSATSLNKPDAEEKQSVDHREERAPETKSMDNHPNNRSRCHSCSGPRLWFFAEKLRLKRRLTPYPDPPRE